MSMKETCQDQTEFSHRQHLDINEINKTCDNFILLCGPAMIWQNVCVRDTILTVLSGAPYHHQLLYN